MKILVGSHNYNLNSPTSDKDYKVVFLPTFDDLYSKKEYSHPQIITDIADYDFHDVRKLENVWWKANINFLEMLYSEETHFHPGIDYRTHMNMLRLFEMRDEIVTMNLPYLFDACIGMHINKVKLMHKGTAGTMHLVEQFGYDTKQAQHAWRVLNFLIRYADNDFKDFKKAIWYENHETDRILINNIKEGFHEDIDYMKEVLDIYKKYVEENYAEIYKSRESNLETQAKLQNIIKEIVKENI
jgi:predicted nucleotidyltransferase